MEQENPENVPPDVATPTILMLLVAVLLKDSEEDNRRRVRMKYSISGSLQRLGIGDERDLARHLTSGLATLGQPERAAAMVSASFRHPFAPQWFELRDDDILDALGSFADLMGLPQDVWNDIRTSVRDVQKKPRGFEWKRAAVVAGLAGLVVASAGAVAAPAIGSVFAASGLSGAAASLSGLAALGGGTIAAGGFGVAGGLGVVTATAGAGGAGVAAALTALLALPREQFNAQLAELWVTYDAVVSKDRHDQLSGTDVLTALRELGEVLAEQESEELRRNDPKAPVIDELKQQQTHVRDLWERVREREAARRDG